MLRTSLDVAESLRRRDEDVHRQAEDDSQRKNVDPVDHPASPKSERGPTMMEMNPDEPNFLPASTILDERGPTMTKESDPEHWADPKSQAEPAPEQGPEVK